MTVDLLAPDRDAAVDGLVRRMSRDFAAPLAEIRAHVIELFEAFAEARVQTFVPVLVERQVRARLRAAGFPRQRA